MNLRPAHEALAAAAALRASAQLGIADRLSTAPMDARSLAAECELSERGTRHLLDALAALGVIEPAGAGAFRNAPGADLLSLVLELYDDLPDAVRTGDPIQTWSSTEVAGAVYPRVVPLLPRLYETAAERAAQILAGPTQLILDVGAGAAAWSLALASRDAGTIVTALDLPEVLPTTRRAVAAHDLEARYRFLAGDAFATDLGGPYDLALVGNLCHLFGPTANVRLLTRLRRCLVPGGRVAIIDVMPSNGRIPPSRIALYQLSLLLRTTEGAAYPFSTYVDWLSRCGYRDIERVELDSTEGMSLVLATVA